MASSFSPQSPSIFKGALAIYNSDEENRDPVIVPFQYNPNQVRRTLAHRAPRNEGGNGGNNTPQDMRLVAGPPVETLNMSVEIVAADALEIPDDNELVAKNGLYPALAALEMLMYAPSFQFEQNDRLAEGGVVNLEPAMLPLTLLVMGESRVIPVHVTSFSVTEEAFDSNLNPIRAKVDLGMQVLTPLDVQDGANQTKAVDVFVAYQKRKEKLAKDHQSQTPAGERTTRLLAE